MSEQNNKKIKTAPTPNGDYLRVIPLGGLDEVGMNCCLIECNGAMIMIDCGLTFPEQDAFGIDVILPDWSYALDNLDKLDAVVLTHGHEDHIGALPFFLREVDVPVYGGRLTLAMLRNKLQEHKLDGEVELHEVEPGDRVQLATFNVEFIHTNHSVPNAMSVSLETPLGRLLFTGDWKLDQTPLGEKTMDLQRMAELGREGVLMLLGDSTNAGAPGYSESESSVIVGLGSVLDTAQGRVFITQFSSNLYRIQAMLELAGQFGRKVALMGRSLLNNFDTAIKLGFIKAPNPSPLIDLQDMSRYPDDEILIITTGSQAEPRSGLTRMAYGGHSQVHIKATDTIVLSARVIPGNERGVQNMINALTKRGARVITPRQAPVHATGHAKQEELKLLLNLTKPKHLVPMHGSFHMRHQHAELGRLVGVPHQHLIEDGHVLQVTPNGVAVIDRVHVGRVFVDGRATGGDIEDVQLRDRKKLAQAGMIVAFAVINRSTGELASGPDLIQRGFLNEEAAAMLEPAAQLARRAVEQLPRDARFNVDEVSEAIRNSLRRYFRKQVDRKPVVLAIVHEM